MKHIHTLLPKSEQVAVIREEECIGCTKCIDACPMDAIMGATKLMHTVINDACCGCERCVAPCPVDCIDIIPLPASTPLEKEMNEQRWEERHEKQQMRLQREKKHQTATLTHRSLLSLSARQQAIHAAVARVKVKKDSVTYDD